MSQTCRQCLWISDDDADFCERCGEAFDPQRARQLSSAANETFRAAAVIFGVVVLGAVVVQRLNAQFPAVWDAAKASLRAFYVWLLGPNEIYKPYLVSILAITALTWIVLWLLARLR